MKKTATIIIFLFVNLAFAQEDCQLTKNESGSIFVVDSNDLKCIAKTSKNKNTIFFTFGVWCAPCRFHLKDALSLKENYDSDLIMLLTEPENDPLIQKNIDYLHKIDPTIKIVLLKDKYGKKRGHKYRRFLKEITPERFENVGGMSKYIVFDNNGEILMVTNWKDSRDDHWKDDSIMLKKLVHPLLKL